MWVAHKAEALRGRQAAQGATFRQDPTLAQIIA